MVPNIYTIQPLFLKNNKINENHANDITYIEQLK